MLRVIRFRSFIPHRIIQQKIRSTAYRGLCDHVAIEQRKQLLVFPEYNAAEGLFREGRYGQAKLQYERVLDVVTSVMGLHSPAASTVRRKLATSLYYGRDNMTAMSKLLYTDIAASASEVDVTDSIRAAQLLATCYLQQWQPSQAQAVADIAVKRNEEANSSDGGESDESMSLLSPSYALKGLSCYALDDKEEAETYFQLASRWASSPIQQLQALSNLGLLTSDNILHNISGNSVRGVLQSRLNRAFIVQQPLYDVTSRDEIVWQSAATEALQYYQAALDVAESTHSDSNNSIGAALCGVASSDMTGLGGEVVTVAKSGTSSTVHVDYNPETLLFNDIDFTASYVSTLCNIAELCECVGDVQKKEDYISATLKTLDQMTAQAEEVSGGTGSHRGKQVDALLGRALGLAAHSQLCMGQAVAAEGLIRSALTKFDAAPVSYDRRYALERTLLQSNYGILLSKWDRREANGAKIMQESRTEMLKLLANRENGNSEIPLLTNEEFLKGQMVTLAMALPTIDSIN